jgi:transposase
VITDGLGRAVAFRIAPGQAHELPHAIPLLDSLPGVPMWVVADRGYSSHSFREHIWSLGARPAIPTKGNETPVACPDWIYNNRNVVERLWARLKEWRAVATRYEKTARSFVGVLCLATAIDWIRRSQAVDTEQFPTLDWLHQPEVSQARKVTCHPRVDL